MLKLYNTLSRSIEEFKPINPQNVGMYSCGPTVYDYQHIGHMRRYVGDDILLRVFAFNGYNVKHVMNITDVGHLVSDADTGEDKMEKGAKKFNKSVWDIAKMFEEQFKQSCKALNIELPKDLMHATDFIKEQIDLIKTLEEKGFTYHTTDGIYFDTSKFPTYFQLSHQNPKELKAGARVEMVAGKRHITDFALWKFDPDKSKTERGMNWWFEGKFAGEPVLNRPATKADLDEAIKRFVHNSMEDREAVNTIGFPGWHIECSAMSMKALGETFDIHTGGIDHINIHHTNEIAQAEAASGKKFVNYWMHHNFLLVEGAKMSKSLENFYTVQDIIAKGFDPMDLRYLYLQTHYRQEMNFTWEALDAGQHTLNRLRDELSSWEKSEGGVSEFEERFLEAINDDLNMPKALAVVWELVKSDAQTSEKAASLLKMDKVLGLNLQQESKEKKRAEIPQEVMQLVQEREALRKQKRFHLADQMRNKIKKMGYEVLDEDGKTVVKIRNI